MATFHVLLNIPYIVYLLLRYTGQPSPDPVLQTLVYLILPLLNCLTNISVYFNRMSPLRLKLLQCASVSRVYLRGIKDILKTVLCLREKNRVVPASTNGDITANKVTVPVRQMKSIELTEMVDTWYDSELAEDQQSRFVNYLYSPDTDPLAVAVMNLAQEQPNGGLSQ